MDKKRERMKELTELLTKAGKAYYQESREIMSNFEYDRLYDELQKLEEETGIVLAGSPTRQVGYEVLEELPKERHEQPMLSLDKTKEVEVLKDFVGAHKVLLSWKMDGLTVVLTYREGTLFKAVTRGNGEIGEVITNNEFLKMFRLRYHIRASWSFAERRLFLIKILRRSMKRLQMWMQNTKIREICAVGLCVS